MKKKTKHIKHVKQHTKTNPMIGDFKLTGCICGVVQLIEQLPHWPITAVGFHAVVIIVVRLFDGFFKCGNCRTQRRALTLRFDDLKFARFDFHFLVREHLAWDDILVISNVPKPQRTIPFATSWRPCKSAIRAR